MEVMELFRIGPSATKSLLSKAISHHANGDWCMTTFNGLPTAMLFTPNADHEGSLHYMFFPNSATQRFHYHPGSRCLILLGDVDVYVYYSDVPTAEDPNDAAHCIELPKYTFNAVRFRPCLWHRFETRSASGLGVVAFSFHGDDKLEDKSSVSKDLMEEITIFWGD